MLFIWRMTTDCIWQVVTVGRQLCSSLWCHWKDFWSQEKKNACWLWDPMGNVVTKDSERCQTRTNPSHRVAGTRRGHLQLPLMKSSSHLLKFHYFLWPVLSIFTCKLVTFIGCSFLLTIKQCKIKKQSEVPFLSLRLIMRQDCMDLSKKRGCLWSLNSREPAKALKSLAITVWKALAVLSEGRPQPCLAAGVNDNEFLWPEREGRLQTTTRNFFEVTVWSLKSLWFCLWI